MSNTRLTKLYRSVTDSPLRLPWAEMQAKLDVDPRDWVLHEYKAASGGEISQTLGAQAERIKAGKAGSANKNTCSYVYHVRSGNGRTEIETPHGITRTVRWSKGDTFAVPAWSTILHHASNEDDAYLFAFCDRPALKALSMYVADMG